MLRSALLWGNGTSKAHMSAGERHAPVSHEDRVNDGLLLGDEVVRHARGQAARRHHVRLCQLHLPARARTPSDQSSPDCAQARQFTDNTLHNHDQAWAILDPFTHACQHLPESKVWCPRFCAEQAYRSTQTLCTFSNAKHTMTPLMYFLRKTVQYASSNVSKKRLNFNVSTS